MDKDSVVSSWSGYHALVDSAAVVPLDRRTKIRLTGKDRASFLNNLCTNEVAKLSAGEGCEAFFCDVKGKIVGHALVLVEDAGIVLDATPGQNSRLLPHLDRYIIREDVTLADLTDDQADLYIAGPKSTDVLASVGLADLPADRLAHAEVSWQGLTLHVTRVDWTQPGGWLVTSSPSAVEVLLSALVGNGVVQASTEEFEAARIEALTPRYGQDITDANLPQEVARETQTINFRKGCYLGQETVARIDALGHVNKTLCGVVFDGETVPPPGTELMAGDKAAGQVTSSSWSPRWNKPMALAYCRRGQNSPGTVLASEFGEARVIDALSQK
jgi:folate-binding protein YgfZ